MTTLASQQLWIGLGIVGFLFVSLTMILIVLIQKPQGGGLSGAFGSSSDGGAGQTAFGAKTGDVLTTLTISIFIVFLVSAAGLNYLVRPSAGPAQGASNAAGGTGGSGSTAPQPATPSLPTQGGGSIDLQPMDGPPPGFNEDGTPVVPGSDVPPAPPSENPDLDPPADGTPEDGTPEG